MNLDSFWAGYDATLKRIRDERPATVDAVVKILNDFESPSSGIAFFGNNADDRLDDALRDAGWDVRYIEGDYVWQALNPDGMEFLHSVEGDIYRGRYGTQ